MDCSIIFYAARKTAYCERALRKSLLRLDMSRFEAAFAVSPAQLGALVTEGFGSGRTVFVIGSLSDSGRGSLKDTISRALASADVDECKKLKCGETAGGFIVRSGSQLLVLLPDSPELIEEVMSGVTADYIQYYFSAEPV